MSDAYDADLGRLAREVAEEQGCSSFLQQGVYCNVGGPAFETVAESKILLSLGADAVGEYKTLIYGQLSDLCQRATCTFREHIGPLTCILSSD